MPDRLRRSSFRPRAPARSGAALAAAFDPFHHDALRLSRADRLARLGLSRPKIKTLRAIAAAVAKGHIDLEAVGRMEADQAHAALDRAAGIGPWTADIYLLFCLGNADAWPAGDLAIQEAVRIAFNLRKRPDAKEWSTLAETWRPWRGVAAHLFWAYYHAVKRREGAPVTPRPFRAGSSRKKEEGEGEWPVNLTGRGWSHRADRPAAGGVPARLRRRRQRPDRHRPRLAGAAAGHRVRVAARAAPCGQAPTGREWFPLTFRNPNERWTGVNAAGPALKQFLDTELARRKLPPRRWRWSASARAP